MKTFKMWVYHKTEDPQIISSDEQKDYESKGWSDSPAKFIKTTDFGIDPDDAMAVQGLGDTIEGVKNMANGAINIDIMDKKQLEAYAKLNFSVDIDRRKGIKSLRKEVHALINK